MSESSSGTSDTSESDSPLLESAYPSEDPKQENSPLYILTPLIWALNLLLTNRRVYIQSGFMKVALRVVGGISLDAELKITKIFTSGNLDPTNGSIRFKSSDLRFQFSRLSENL